ncbi:MAG: hypothetical protein AAF409_18860 [Pseudomonadota bacterium]
MADSPTAFDRVFGPRRVRIDWGAFVLAAVLAPVIFAISGLVLLFYGVFLTIGAVVMGAPVYLTLGLAAAYLAITRHAGPDGLPGYGACLGAAFLATLAAWPGAVAVVMWGGDPLAAAIGHATTYVFLGLIAGPIQGLLFAWIYRANAIATPVSEPDTFA